MHYITQSIPSSSYFLNAGKTRVVYDIIRVSTIPEDVKKKAEILIKDRALADYLGVAANATFTKLEGKQATFWYAKYIGDAGPSQMRVEYYRINVSFMDVAELIDFENGIDEEVYRLCEDRKVDPVADGFTTNAIEFRCSELGVFPTREDNHLVLREPISNNEARVIAKHHNTEGVDLLAEYDVIYLKAFKLHNMQPVMTALAELNLI